MTGGRGYKSLPQHDMGHVKSAMQSQFHGLSDTEFEGVSRCCWTGMQVIETKIKIAIFTN